MRELRKVKINDYTKQDGWFHRWFEVENSFKGHPTELCAIVETPDGKIRKILCDNIIFLETPDGIVIETNT